MDINIVDFLPTLVTAFIVGPLGWYAKKRLENLASKNDFGQVLSQLKKKY